MYIKIYNACNSKQGMGEGFTVDLPIDNERDIREQLDEYLIAHRCKPDYYDWEVIEAADNAGVFAKLAELENALRPTIPLLADDIAKVLEKARG